MVKELYPWLIAGIGGAIGAFLTALLLLIPKIGETFFKARLDRALETYKSEQGRQIEDLRERLSHLGDRGRRSNENEFTALRSLWELFIEAYYSTYAAIINFMSFPPLNTMPDDQVTEFLENNEFNGTQIAEILATNERERAFSRAITWRQISKARSDNFSCTQALRKQRVFISDDIRREFMQALDFVTSAQVERQIGHELRRGSTGKYTEKFLADGDKIVDALATSVNRRLFRDEIR